MIFTSVWFGPQSGSDLSLVRTSDTRVVRRHSELLPCHFSSSDSGHQKWKLRCWNSSSKPRRLDLQHLCCSPLWAAPPKPSSRSSFPLLVLLQPQLRLLLFREENAAIAAVDAIVDKQLWLSAKRGQWLTRPPWQRHHHHRRILPVLSSSIPLRHLLLGGGK